MAVKIIQERLDQSGVTSWQEEELIVKQIYQEVALAALSRTDFFKKAVFQGGTALRILHSLERFSEDLDFILKKPDTGFSLQAYLGSLQEEFRAYGIPIVIQDKSKLNETVQKLFLKQESAGMMLVLKHHPRDRRPEKIRVKIEVDTRPPAGSIHETKYLDFPFAFGVTVQDLPSLFAGKSHALLCRGYTKGRDWYDFLWYVARRISVNFDFLSHACHQTGPWQGKDPSINKQWYLNEMKKKVNGIDWKEAREDVQRFLRPHELPTLDLWGREFFLDRLQKMDSYLS
ncbi:MAG: nucleotidyl transferase AbiEii/AbiGii toxin family protein [Deltaproteobacteria bacterium]|nr:nucleotidyl transferase AbiEii/AbiGii toxin family protein [Deltaproteobacteria bacterium]